MEFVGEHLLIGNIGHFAAVLAFTTAILTGVAYFFASNENELTNKWKKIARTSFRVHSVSVLVIIVALFLIIFNHYYEYYYAWQHSSNDLPTYYIISCFWEGQEGSFLLWVFWHVVIGTVLLRTARKWEAPVMAVICLAQVMLTSMLLGLDFELFKVGSSPFALLRDTLDAPIFSDPNYLSIEQMQDGTGLNPLLQNYWMVIHPPTLFFGFAATVVPFAYAIAGLWKNKFQDWVKPALPWALVAVMVLGLGIMMGGYWAYEALSFGGYWAWDPVENASLIPWLILIAGVHVMIINKSTKGALIMTFVLILFTFLLVLYATYLTRSGVLSETSAHSFAAGLPGQLVIFLLLFVFGTLILFFVKFKDIPKSGQEEHLTSREFWMFIGSLVLLLSCLQVLFTTSTPVFSLIPGVDIAPPDDVIAHYNKWQMPFAIVIALLTGFTQFAKYKKTNSKKLWKDILTAAIISCLVTIGAIFGFQITHPYFIIFLFAGIYAVAGNILYIATAIKGKILSAGASVAHVGFGILLVGVLVSSANKHIISQNNTGGAIFGLPEEKQNDAMEVAKTARENQENMLLAKDMPVNIGDYRATFIGSYTEEPNKYYKVLYQKLNDKFEVEEEFILEPNSQNNPKMGMASNPATKHYWTHDVFTYVSFDPMLEEPEEFSEPTVYEVYIGDTIHSRNADIVLDSATNEIGNSSTENTEIRITANLKVLFSTEVYRIYPEFALNGAQTSTKEAISDESGILARLLKIVPDEDRSRAKYVIEVSTRRPRPEYIIMKAIVFPWIRLVWAGTLVMVIGFIISIIKRVKEYRRKGAERVADNK